jgi:cysteine-rich repeat protein
MRSWHFLGLLSCFFSCQLLFRPDPLLFLENTVSNCFDGVDNDGENGADCEDPSCEAICNDDQLKINALTSNNCTIVTHEAITGDDRGGLAVGLNRVLYSGDTTTAAFSIDDLDVSPFPLIYDAIFSDLRSGKFFTFVTAPNTPLLGVAGTAVGFQEIDPQTGSLIGTTTLLSQNIDLGKAGFFSGKGQAAVVSNNNLFLINIADGDTTLLLAAVDIKPTFCEIDAFWGILETDGEQRSLVYVSDSSTILRKGVAGPSFDTEVVAKFASLDDMCAISVSSRLNRWYFHAESFTSLTPLLEHLGYCDALFGVVPTPVCGDGIFQAPEQCDDGNAVDGDGCTGCILDFCGDGLENKIIQGNSLEVCDDGNNTGGDGCRGDCRGTEICGDGLFDTNEQCEDGNTINGDGCEADCTFVCAANLSLKAAFLDATNGHCYALLSEFGEWPAMRNFCISAGGDANELALVLPVAANFGAWTGFNDINLEGTFVWSNGDAVTFNNFAAGQPDNFNGDEDCASFLGDGTWNDLPCTNGNHPLCEIP